ncbi:MAG: rhodanese-like domain-containing protein [Pseudomonadota bacterium]
MNPWPAIKRELKPCGLILAAALALGWLFNLVMPQGVGWVPPEVANPLWRRLPAAEVQTLVRAGALLLDAREAGDYAKARVRGALKLPADEIAKLYPLMQPLIAKAPAVVVYGQSTSRFPAATVAQHLRSQGFIRVYVVEGCLDTLEKAGFAIQRPRRGGGA